MRVRFGLLAALGFALATAVSAWSTPAGAMALPTPGGLKDAAATINLTETVHCRAVWRCGPYGCGWRRVCWGPPHYYRPYSVYRPYRYYRPYRVYRPYPYYHRRVYRPAPWVSGPYYGPGFYFGIGVGPRYYW